MSDEIQGTDETQTPAGETSEGTPTPSETPAPIATPEPVAQPIMIPKPRFDEVNRRMHEAEAEIARYRNPAQSQEQPKGPPKQDEYATYEEYIRADSRFHAEQAAEKKWNDLSQRAQQQDFQRKASTRLADAESNWVSKVSSAPPATIQAIQAAPVAPVQTAWIQIQEADNNVAVAEFLSKNPAEMTRINQMWPDQQAREIARLDVKLAASGGPSKMPSAKAPNLDPVGGGNTPAKKDPYNTTTSAEDYVLATRRLPGK